MISIIRVLDRGDLFQSWCSRPEPPKNECRHKGHGRGHVKEPRTNISVTYLRAHVLVSPGPGVLHVSFNPGGSRSLISFVPGVLPSDLIFRISVYPVVSPSSGVNSRSGTGPRESGNK